MPNSRNSSKQNTRKQQPIRRARNPASKKTTQRGRTRGNPLGLRMHSNPDIVSLASSSSSPNTGPVFLTQTRDCTRIQHREFVGTVCGSTTTWLCTPYAIQPGLPAVFPWLSSVANSFESYRFKALRFDYVSRVAATRGGGFYMAIDYDPIDAPPGSKSDMASYLGAVDGVVWSSLSIVSPLERMKKFDQRFTRNTLVPSSDLKTYDVGNLYVATDIQSDTTALGDIYVNYDIELLTPQVQTKVVGGEIVSRSTVDGITPFPTAATTSNIGKLPYKVTDAPGGGSTLTFIEPFTGLIHTSLTKAYAAAPQYFSNLLSALVLGPYSPTVNRFVERTKDLANQISAATPRPASVNQTFALNITDPGPIFNLWQQGLQSDIDGASLTCTPLPPSAMLEFQPGGIWA